MHFLILLILLTNCNTTDPHVSAKIEHITRQGKEQDYSKLSRPYIDKSEEEALFDEAEFLEPKARKSTGYARSTLTKQEEMEELAKLKRAGRLSQKDYAKRVELLHKKHQVKTTPAEKTITNAPEKKQSPYMLNQPKIEKLEIEDELEDYDE
ncbi:MAG: hypothetical protein H6850_03010 [Alphaproteobacteria bacterium]|nr:MAG: hypothetical protein H6850_03010 [Alphaproteobacteria bacterium]